MTTAYTPGRTARSIMLPVRGLSYHVRQWGDASLVTAERPALVLVHGWMDVGASFQFTVDALAGLGGPERLVLAPAWRGFGLTTTPPVDTYWIPDYLGDLDALLDQLAPGQAVDLVGHSMGGNVVMSYAGVRPSRVRRLVNLEGFGLPASDAQEAPTRLARWLDELREPTALKTFDDLGQVAARLRKTNPRLDAERAAWLAGHWAREGEDGRWHVLGDPAHKRTNPVLYRVPEVLATWQRIQAPVLWVEGAETDIARWWGHRYPRSEFDARLGAVKDCRREVLAAAGHMLHHDQPLALARLLADFLGPPHPP